MGVSPMLVSMQRPSRIALMLAPLPNWHVIKRLPCASLSRHCSSFRETYCAGDRAIADAHQDLRVSAHALDLVQVFLGAHRPFDDRDIHILGKHLRIHVRSVNDLDALRQVNQALVHIEY
jgi:hypothetical protein